MKTESPERCSRVVTVHLEPELHDAIKQVAQKDGRTVSNWIRTLTMARVRGEAMLETAA
jgi:hypothetical protein